MFSRKLDMNPRPFETPLDAAIREWIVPALARRFLQLQSQGSEPSLAKDANPKDAARNYSSEDFDYGARGRGTSAKEHI